MRGAKKVILVLEDDPQIRQALRETLGAEGYVVEPVATLAEARRALREKSFDLALLDLSLPDGLSFDFCRELRAEHPSLPVVFVTASVDENTAVKGLALGAADYIRKPFGRQELLMRLKNLLKNNQGHFSAGTLTLDLDRREARCGKKIIPLSPTEFNLLAGLLQSNGEALSRDKMLELADERVESGDPALASHLSRIRAKLKKAGVKGVQIKSVFGWGYRLEKDAA